MSKDHTAPDLLEAVGIDWKTQYGCESRPSYELGGDNTAYFAASNDIKYTGPEIGTPELDDILLVAGQRWLTKQDTTTKMEIVEAIPRSSASTHQTLIWLMCHCDTPGHALARAIAEVNHA